MNKNDMNGKALFQAEINALTMQTMTRVRRGDTIPTDGVYKRMMTMLEGRAKELLSDKKMQLESVNDWLALALFMEDRRSFVKLCEKGSQNEDPIYRRAEHWLRPIIDEDMKQLNANSGDKG